MMLLTLRNNERRRAVVHTARHAGPTAIRVAQNVERLRREQGLDLKTLSAAMSNVGQPVSVSQLSRLETGGRRVDVDDLVALALALGVTPARLLLPGNADDEGIALTSTVRCSAAEAWHWSAGARPLPRPGEPFDVDRAGNFAQENAPHVPRDEWTSAELAKHQDVLVPFADAARAAASAGVPWVTLRNYLGLTQSLDAIKKAVRRGKR